MSIIDEIKSIGKILQEAGKIDLYQKILDIQAATLEMLGKIQKLEDENKELKEKLKIKENIFPENNAYWFKKDESQKDGPFCTRCWDVDKNLVRLHPCGNPAYYKCPNCESNPVQIKTDSYPYHSRRPPNNYL